MATLQAFLKEHSDFFRLDNGKVVAHLCIIYQIKCTTTSHEMEANLETVETHFKSKKYYLAKSYQDFDITKYEQNYMIPHKDHPKKVYCTLTGASKYCLFFKK